MQKLFVYGTLAPGGINHRLLEGIPGSWEPATLKGRLFEEGWGAALGCPGIVPSEDGDEIKGFVFSSSLLAEYWSMLDEFEGDGYKRVLVDVTVNTSHNTEAYVYCLNRPS